MQDPNWIDPAPPLASVACAKAAAKGKPRLTDKRERTYKERTPQELVEDVMKLAGQQYDLSGRLQRERDAADKALLNAQTKLGWANIKIWILTAVVGTQCLIIGWVVTRLWEQMTK
jgi:hypothetical protein